jgi:two-component system chemotaxis response regulator CheY
MARILLVEDSSSMRAYVRAALEASAELGDGVELVEAASGFDALRLLPRGSYDLVITDINMPDINGLELLRFVRQGAQHRDTAGARDLDDVGGARSRAGAGPRRRRLPAEAVLPGGPATPSVPRDARRGRRPSR